ncbi:hypothetical protein KL86CLO1_10478 [uncultured Eubacteriales bacterium]|uniref:Uncharacterized protein n=1 Tax=uncultured Eubacteriales bacterium TaxID=172733 RepID=A0A212J3Z0_9FIRM|nr:hypothetical protein KL86CLO1_10478 [uncultured Eubacteriales bacterium]
MYENLITQAEERVRRADERFEETGEWRIGDARSLISELTVALRNVVKAQQDGRLVVLPCKVGDEIFSFRWSIKNEKHEVTAGKVKNVRYDTADGIVTVSDGERYCIWGKTVFLTRSEAEAALGGKADEV